MVRTTFLTFLSCAAFVACEQKNLVDDTDTDNADATAKRITLTFPGVGAKLAVPPGRAVTLKVLAEDTATRAAVANLAISFTTAGSLAGSKLSATSATTGADGSAYINITGGNQVDATFKLTAGATDANAISVDVTVDVNAPANPSGSYDMATTIEPLEFMSKSTSTYATLYNVLTAIANPADLVTDWKSFDSTTMTTTTIDRCQNPSGVWAVMCPFKALIPVGIKALLGLADPAVSQVYEGIRSAGQALKEVRIGGTLQVKNYNSYTHEFDAQYVFDTYRFLWTADKDCVPGGAQVNNPCCGHSLFDSTSLSLKPFLRACNPSSTSTTCNDTKGTILADSSSKTDFSINVNEATLELGYGAMVVGVLENVVLPRALDPVKFDPDGDGRVPLATAAQGVCGVGDVTCQAVAGVVGEMVSALASSLSTTGSSDFNAKFTITNARLRDFDLDGQPEQVTGELALTGTAGGGSSIAPAPFTALFAHGTDSCTSDATCTGGTICRFAKNPIDACFTRNVCARPVGTRAAAAGCTTDNECRSGVCADVAGLGGADFQNACVQVCNSDSECGGKTCKAKAIVATDTGNGEGAEITVAASGLCIP